MKNVLLELISKEKIEEAIVLLIENSYGKFENELQIIKSNYLRLGRDKNSGVVSWEDRNRELNKINLALLDICDNITVREEKSKEELIFKKGKEIDPFNLLGARSFPKNNFNADFYYYRKYFDDLLIEKALLGRNIIVTGKPFSGKSRGIYETIKNYLKEKEILIVREENDLSRINNSIANKKHIILIFDDLDQFLSSEKWRKAFLGFSQQRNIQILSTIRTSQQELAEDTIGELFFVFDIIPIPKLTLEEKNQIRILVQSRKSDIDDTIGSFFLELGPMKNRFKHHLTLTQKEILRTYKVFQLWRRRNRGNKALINEYIEIRYAKFYEITLAHTPSEWTFDYSRLAYLGFITDGIDKIQVEEVYLDKIIFPELNEEKISKEVLAYYPGRFNYNKLISRISSLKLGERLISKMKTDGLQPNEITYNSLLNKSENYQEAQGVLELMKTDGLQPNEITYTSLLNKSENYQEAQGVLELMKTDGLQPNEITYTSLLNKSENYQEAQGVLELMKTDGLQPNEITYNSLLNKSENYQEAQGVLELMKTDGLQPNEITYNSLLNKSENYQEAQGVLELMKNRWLTTK